MEFVLNTLQLAENITGHVEDICTERPILLISFRAEWNKPDRKKALAEIVPSPHFTYTRGLNHSQWLQAIIQHRFTLAPLGHGICRDSILPLLLLLLFISFLNLTCLYLQRLRYS